MCGGLPRDRRDQSAGTPRCAKASRALSRRFPGVSALIGSTQSSNRGADRQYATEPRNTTVTSGLLQAGRLNRRYEAATATARTAGNAANSWLPGRATQSRPVQPGQVQQGQSQPDQAPPDDPRPVNLVVVPVTVKDSSNQLVGDLRRDEFRILEDGVEQRISLFSVETAPLSVVVVVDNDLKPKTADAVHKTLEEIAAGFSASDEVAVGRFDAFYTPVLDFTSDNDKLLTQLKNLQLGDNFATGSSL